MEIAVRQQRDPDTRGTLLAEGYAARLPASLMHTPDPGHGRARDVLDQVTEGMASSRGAAQREFDRVDTYRDDNKALFEDKRYSGFQTRGALFKSRRDNQRQFCAKQLKAKLTPVLKLS